MNPSLWVQTSDVWMPFTGGNLNGPFFNFLMAEFFNFLFVQKNEGCWCVWLNHAFKIFCIWILAVLRLKRSCFVAWCFSRPLAPSQGYFSWSEHSISYPSAPYQWRSGSVLKTGRLEVLGSNSDRACQPSRSEFSMVFSETRVNTR